MLNVVMLNVVMLNVIMLNVIMLSAIGSRGQGRPRLFILFLVYVPSPLLPTPPYGTQHNDVQFSAENITQYYGAIYSHL
jgi:hypothetical protein